MSNVVTSAEVIRLYDVLHAAMHCAKVARVIDGAIVNGTARCMVESPDRPMSMPRDMDMRDGFLWVTLATGFEAFWPVRELAAEIDTGHFGEYDW